MNFKKFDPLGSIATTATFSQKKQNINDISRKTNYRLQKALTKEIELPSNKFALKRYSVQMTKSYSQHQQQKINTINNHSLNNNQRKNLEIRSLNVSPDFSQNNQNIISHNHNKSEIDSLDEIFGNDKPILEVKGISLDELRFLLVEFQKNRTEKDFRAIDSIITKNSFFSKFELSTRIGFISYSKIKIIEQNDLLLSSEVQDNNCYIILKGSCVQMMYFNQNKDSSQALAIQSFYEGQEMSQRNITSQLKLYYNKIEQQQQKNIKLDVQSLILQMQEHVKNCCPIKQQSHINTLQKIEITAQEKTYLLYLENSYYQQLLKDQINQDEQKKLEFLKSIYFIQQVDYFQLLQLIPILQQNHYMNGQYIIKKGQFLSQLIIISKGEFEVIVETRLTTFINKEKNKSNSNFQFKTIRDRNTKLSYNHRQNDAINLSFIQTYKRRYQFCNKQLIGDNQLQYTHLYSLRTFKQGDFLAIRSITNCPDEQKFAKLSVITKSVSGSAFALDKKNFYLLPESLQQQIITGITEMKEFDDIDITNLQQQITKWHNYKLYSLS